MDDAGARLIASFLESNRGIQKLNLSKWFMRPLEKNKIHDDGAKAIWESLRKNNTLQNLSLAANGIGRGGVQPLAKILAENFALLELDLCIIRIWLVAENEIDAEGSRYILEGMRKNKVLLNINLGKLGM